MNPSSRRELVMEGIPLTLIRSRRRSLLLQVDGGRVVARAPLRAPLYDIAAFVSQKANWIRRQLDEQRAREQPPNRRYLDGDRVLFRGEGCILKVERGPRNRVVHIDGELRVTVSPRCVDLSGRVRQVLGAWLAQQTLADARQAAQRWAPRIGCDFQSVTVRRYRARWGSCDSRGRLFFHSLLSMAPRPVLDYVVVHELCHRLEFNHSPRFWGLVAEQVSDYPEQRQWLTQHAALLTWD